jgi:lysophospholipase L1-like esterase
MLAKGKPAIPQGIEFDQMAISRLHRLRELCEEHGAKLILLIPPTPSSDSAARQMATASRKAGVETLVPVDSSLLATSYYLSDETHLNSKGAALFTSALATSLRKKIVTAEPMTSVE